MSSDRFEFNRAAFLSGSLAAMAVALPEGARSAAPAGPESIPKRVSRGLVAGNERFVNNDLPVTNALAEKRELLKEGQAPFAAILGCSDSRVIPNLIFVSRAG